MSDALSNFVCLDELTQVIYQGFYKFVVLSSVSDDEWTVHVGLAEKEGRWWRGCWQEEDVLRFFGSKSTEKLLESFAEKLAEVFIQGELCITDWSPDRGADVKFTLGPTTQKPVHIPLTEMPSEEAAAYATSIFIDIALQAQSRKCKLYPSTSDYTPSLLSHALGPVAVRSTLAQSHQNEPPPIREETSPELLAEAEPPQLVAKHPVSPPKSIPHKRAPEAAVTESYLKDPKKAGPSTSGTSATKPIAPVRAKKGASLANPNKKARKYQAIEFGSDEE